MAGQNTYTGATTVDSGAQLDLTGTISDTSNVTVNTGGTLVIRNGGALTSGGVNNQAGGHLVIEAGGTLTDDMDNSGTTDNSGVSNAIVNTNTGTINNYAGAIWNGDVRSNTGIIANAGEWNGNINNAGTFATSGVLHGNLTNSGSFEVASGGNIFATSVANSGFLTVDSNGTLAGDLVNTGWGEVANSGTVTSDVSNAYLAGISNSGAWTGSLANSGTVVNSGTWTGDATNAPSSEIFNSGTWIGNITNAGSISNSFLIGDLSNTGSATNLGSISGAFVNSGTGSAAANFGTVEGGARNSGGTFVNLGTVSGGVVVTGGTFASPGTVAGGLSNSATTNASGVVNGSITNSGNGVFNVTGTLGSDNSFDNTGAAQLNVLLGDYTGLTSITNRSTNETGIAISASHALAGITLNNTAGATVINQGTLTTSEGMTNGGVLWTAGTLNGDLSNTGTVMASGMQNGATSNSGTFYAIGALQNDGSAFDNTGLLDVTNAAFTGVGVLTNASSGRVAIGTTTTSGELGAASLNNAGLIDMMNGRTGDIVNVAGAYTGLAGSVLTFDVNMMTGAADRLTVGSFNGTSKVKLNNSGAAKTYIGAPIILVASSGGTGTLETDTDAGTTAALSSSGLISYAFTKIADTSDWGIVTRINTTALSSLAASITAFETAQNVNTSGLPDDISNLTATYGVNEMAGHAWAQAQTSEDTLSSQTTISDTYSMAGANNIRLSQNSYRFGYDVGVFNIGETNTNVRLGITAGSTDAKSNDRLLDDAQTRYTVPNYGAYAVLSHKNMSLSIQSRHDILRMDVANPVTGPADAKGIGQTLSLIHI